jgi:hypothetical protein
MNTCTHCQQKHQNAHEYRVNGEIKRICPPCVDSRAEIVAKLVDRDLTPSAECGIPA